MIHFGCNLKKSANELTLSRDNYMYKKKNGEYAFKFKGNWSQEEIAEREQLNLANFDINMHFYDQLDRALFERQLEKILTMFPGFEEVTDLTLEFDRRGIYLLVLGKYKQLYIGKTYKNFLERIKKHWSNNVEFDRLIFFDWRKSKLSIDSFKALDTTQIFVLPLSATEDSLLKIESQLVEVVEGEYLANRLSGGSVDWSNRVTPYMSEKVKLRDLS